MTATLNLIVVTSLYGLVNFYGEIPEDVPTFVIKITRESSEIYGAIIVQNQWLRTTILPELGNRPIEIVLDYPWEKPQPRRRELSHKIEVSYEVPALRKKRLEDGWKQAGYVILDVKSEKKVMSKIVYEQALKSIEMANLLYSLTTPPNLSNLPFSGNSPNLKQSYSLRLWIYHILLSLIFLLIISLIIWRFFFTSQNTQGK